jgi:hypothetical protein
MEKNGYPAINNEKTMFMKRKGNDFIIHSLFVDDMMHVPTCDALKEKFTAKYTKDFQITGGGLMYTFLGMQVGNPRARYVYTLTTTFGRPWMSTRSFRRNRSARSRSRSNSSEKNDCPFFLRRMTAQLFQIQGSRSFIDHFALNSLQHGFISTFHLQWHSWLASVHLVGKTHWAALHQQRNTTALLNSSTKTLGCSASSDGVSRRAFELQADPS